MSFRPLCDLKLSKDHIILKVVAIMWPGILMSRHGKQNYYNFCIKGLTTKLHTFDKSPAMTIFGHTYSATYWSEEMTLHEKESYFNKLLSQN